MGSGGGIKCLTLLHWAIMAHMEKLLDLIDLRKCEVPYTKSQYSFHTIWPKGHSLNTLGRGPLGDVTYQILRL